MFALPLAAAVIATVKALSTSAQIVVAHFMAQNSYSYDANDWTNDITTAQGIGIDGFALNIAMTDYEVDQVATAFVAAENANFKLFFSFDMSYSWQAADVVSLVAAHASSSAMLMYAGGVLVSTYSGEANGDVFFAGIKSSLASEGITITLAPAFTTYRDPSLANSLLSTFPSIDGFFNWWSWPDDVDTTLTTDTDIAYRNAAHTRKGPYIMSVSPWQFKDIDANDNWVELSDTLWNYRWLQAIQDVQPDIVEIVTWNDYAESHYIGDINPNVDLGTGAPNYVDGFPHAAWRIIAQYYIQWYKTGTAPTVTDDVVVFWYRAHPKAVTCTGGWPVRMSTFPADAVFALSLLSTPATISLDIGSTHAQFNGTIGASIGSVNFPVEDAQIPFIQIIRAGTTVKSGYGSVYVTESCSWYNFNPFVGVIQ
ncbi:glycoside hydrolase family 71 protein [Mycena maculata]|uniref:Glycoside hydrolase family 71 protein n=1 Tax=Mycena maculata TaxID=230809 RepID=A0AAD7HY19_9AGAR|nr:glycoside hydrolase family 71 protein [Mycena maculata]